MKYSKPFMHIRTSLERGLKRTKKMYLKEGINFDKKKIIKKILDWFVDGNNLPPVPRICFKNLLYSEFIDKTVLNIYLETKELKEFLLNTEVTKDRDAIRNFICKHGNYVTSKDLKLYQLCIHFRIPEETDAYSCVLYYLHQDNDEVIGAIMIQDTMEVKNNLTVFFANKNDDKGWDEVNRNNIKLALNFIYYVLTFPDALIDGKPVEADRDTDHAFMPKRTLKVHPKIVASEETIEEHDKQVRVTHFRKGHFRHLVSEWFKEKKGQWVFVHGAIVKGAPAKTLLG